MALQKQGCHNAQIGNYLNSLQASHSPTQRLISWPKFVANPTTQPQAFTFFSNAELPIREADPAVSGNAYTLSYFGGVRNTDSNPPLRRKDPAETLLRQIAHHFKRF